MCHRQLESGVPLRLLGVGPGIYLNNSTQVNPQLFLFQTPLQFIDLEDKPLNAQLWIITTVLVSVNKGQ